MNIVLCGMPSSGKSYFGALAARHLHREFIDIDQLLMDEYFKATHRRATCREITLLEGSAYFQSLECAAVKGLKGTRAAIIATGGNTLNLPENVAMLRDLGWMLYLKVPPDTLLKRLKSKQDVPSYLDAGDIEGSFNALLKRRLPLYEKSCHRCIDVSSEDVMEIISAYAAKEKQP